MGPCVRVRVLCLLRLPDDLLKTEHPLEGPLWPSCFLGNEHAEGQALLPPPLSSAAPTRWPVLLLCSALLSAGSHQTAGEPSQPPGSPSQETRGRVSSLFLSRSLQDLSLVPPGLSPRVSFPSHSWFP